MTMQTTPNRRKTRPNFHNLPAYRGTSIEGLVAAVTDLRDRTDDRLVQQGAIAFGHDISDDGGVDLRIDVPVTVPGLGLPGQPVVVPQTLFLSRNAQEQIASKADVPVKYADRMAVEQPGLYATTMQTWFAAEPTTNRLVRSLRVDRADGGQDTVVRAFLSDRFRVIDHADVVLTALGAAAEARPDRGLPSCFKWDVGTRNLDVLLYATEDAVDLRNPDTDPDPAAVGEAVEMLNRIASRGWIHRYAAPSDPGRGGSQIILPAVRIRNSETGHGGLSVEAVGIEGLCSNGWTLGVDLVRYHLGRTLTEDLVASPATMRLENDLIFAKVKDAVRAAFQPEAFRAVVRAMSGLRIVEVPNVDKSIAAIVRRADLGKTAAEDILKLYARVTTPERDTAFDVCRAATSYGAMLRSTGDTDRGYDVEKAVAGVLEAGVPRDLVAV